jgi:hypothetical protein
MTKPRHLRLSGLVVVASLLGAPHAEARQSTHARCDRIGTTAISFGRTGGTLKPSGVRIAPNGIVSDLNDAGGAAGIPASAAASVPKKEVRRLARKAWTGPFARLPTAPTRPTPNPDAARDFIELRSACGTRHVEYRGGTGAPAFRRLLAELRSLTGVR